MIEGYQAGNLNSNTLTAVDCSAGSAAGMRAGSIVSAEVMDYIAQGLVALRITPPAGRGTESTMLRARTSVPLEKGRTVLLEVLGGGKEATFRLIEEAGGPAGNAPPRLLELLNELSASRLSSNDVRLLAGLLKSLPESLRAEFGRVEDLLPHIERLNGALLKSSVEGSGVAYETRLKISVLRGLSEARMGPDGMAAARLAHALGESEVQGALRSAGLQDVQINAILKALAAGREAPMAALKALPLEVAEALGAALRTPAVLDALMGAGLGKNELASLMAALAGVARDLPQWFRGLFDLRGGGGASGLMEGLARALGEGASGEALKGAGLSQLEVALIIGALRGEGSPADFPAGLLGRFAAALGQEGVVNALGASGLGGADISRVLEAMNVRPGVPESLEAALSEFRAEGDVKALLLKLQQKLQEGDFQDMVRQAGFSRSEVQEAAARFLNNIEFFQLASRLHEMFYTYLPVSWDEMREGELLFKKKLHRGRAAYSCDINLDLEPLGMVSAQVTFFDGGYYVSLQAEREETLAMMESGRRELERRFSAQGMALKTINVGGRGRISFGEARDAGVDMRV